MSNGFTIEEPRTVQDALELLGQGDESVRVVAGGTGLTLLMRYGFFQPTMLVSLRHLRKELAGVEPTADGGLRLGAMNTLRDLEDSPEVAARAPLLRQALYRLATIRLRNIAQLGGAIAHGHPQMDLPPILLALNARVRVSGRRGSRWINADDLFLGYYETAVSDDELITEVVLPPPGEQRAVYRKVTPRTADDWPILGVAAVTRRDGGRVSEARVAVGALTDRAQRLPMAEAALVDTDPTPEQLRSIAEETADTLDYHHGPAGSVAFQRQIVAVHLRRALDAVVLGRDGQGQGER